MKEPRSYEPSSHTTSEDLTKTLQKMLHDFQHRAEKLSSAYQDLQRAFSQVNTQLETKNKELGESVRRERDMQLYLHSILESMQNGVIGIDTAGTITHFNRAAMEITGYKAEEIMGKGYNDFFFRKEDEALSLLRALSHKKEFKKEEKCIQTKRGKLIPVSFQASLLRDKNNTILGAVEIFSDISRIKSLESEVQHNKTLAAIGKMSAQVAHEIRNPLGAMGNYVGMLELDTPQDDPRKEMIHKLSQSISRLDKIVQNLLYYSKPTRIDFRRVQLNEFLGDITGHIEAEIERNEYNVDIEARLDSDPPTYAMIDPTKMEEALFNLCFNAIDAMPDGGHLCLSLTPNSAQYEEYLSFSVSDTGIGIKSDDLENIFNPFHTTKEKGTGLGLSIVKKIVDQHSGYIHVESQEGHGTEFIIFLPKQNH